MGDNKKDDGILRDPWANEGREDIQGRERYIVKVLGAKDDAGEGTGTKQLPLDHFEEMYKTGIILPTLYDPMVWAFLLEQNTRLKKLIEAMANNTVGLGWEIVPKKDEESFTQQHKDEIEKERDLYAALIENINPEEPFNEICKKTKTDEEATGQGYIEVVRSIDGVSVVELWHMPGHTLRVGSLTKNRVRYVQMRVSNQTRKVWFKPFGEKHSLDADTGKWDDEEPVKNNANEVVQFKLYTPRSSFYGVPRVVSAAPAIAGNRLAARRNVAFFENDATPRMAIIVNGGELSEESMKLIKEFVDVRAKGPGNAGRIMILQAKGDEVMSDGTAKVHIQIVPLTVGVQDDASFGKYTAANNEEVREAFGIGQIFIGTSDDVNRAVALAMKQLTVEQVFEPESSRYEYRLNRVLMPEAKFTKLRFRRPRTEDIAVMAQAYAMFSAAGGVTPNDVRDFLNKPRFKAKWGDTPVTLAKLGLMEDQSDDTATVYNTYKTKMPPPPPAKGGAPGGGAGGAPKLVDFVQAFGEDKGPEMFEGVQSVAQELAAFGFSVEIMPPHFVGGEVEPET